MAGYSHRCYAMIALAHLVNIIIVDTSVSSWVGVSPFPLVVCRFSSMIMKTNPWEKDWVVTSSTLFVFNQFVESKQFNLKFQYCSTSVWNVVFIWIYLSNNKICNILEYIQVPQILDYIMRMDPERWIIRELPHQWRLAIQRITMKGIKQRRISTRMLCKTI